MITAARLHLTFLYATREKHPTYRVDLKDLFSSNLGRKGHRIDWHMQSIHRASSGWVQMSGTERVCVGRAYAGGGWLGKAFNQLAGLRHDLRLFRMVYARDYDFVQVRDKIFAAFIAMTAAKLRRIPFYYWMSFPYPEADLHRARDHEMPLPRPLRWFYLLRGKWTHWLLYRVVLPRAAHIFVQSDRMKEDVQAEGIDPQRMTPVPMGINLGHVNGAPSPQYETQAAPRLVYTGTLVRLRRIDFLIDMLKRVHAVFPATELILAGDGLPRDMEFLRAEARRLGVEDKVCFTGFLPMEQAWELVRSADVCLSPMRPHPVLDSTTPTKIIEYMAFNKPVVANRHPDQSKVLGESGAGFAVEYEPQAFADAVIELLRDPYRARLMGARGLSYVQQHRSYAALSTALEERYLALLGRRRGPQLARAA